tara:strand:- start:653 stop:859 length:207 start_codon:yes stop_codon:yes gene_type:complete
MPTPPPSLIEYTNENFNKWVGLFCLRKKNANLFGPKKLSGKFKKKSKAKTLEKLDSNVESQQLNLHFF